MEKYKDFSRIRKDEISEFHGLENEVTFSPYKPIELLPLRVSKLGITNPNPSYYIRRELSPCFIIEYIVSGHGYLEVNDVKYKLNPGDAYVIHPGDSCVYYADKNDPYKKYWVNFSTEFFFSIIVSVNLTDIFVINVNVIICSVDNNVAMIPFFIFYDNVMSGGWIINIRQFVHTVRAFVISEGIFKGSFRS